MKNKFYFNLLLISIAFLACKKEPGVGGDASIRGKVYGYHYNSIFTTKLSENYVPDTYVYIIYGNNISYASRIKTSYDGAFEFKNLYKGNYKIYTYSIDSAAIVNSAVNPPNMAVIANVTIKKRKEIFDGGTMKIFN